jgi:hypothetical protein
MSEHETSLVGLSQVRRFLERAGWQRSASEKSSLDVYSLGTGKARVELLLPPEGASKNPIPWINAAVRTLSQLQGATELDLVDEISAFDFDRVRSRLSDDLIRNDTVSLSVAIGMVQGIRALFEAAATTESNPRPYFPRVLKVAKTYTHDCRFGHTFKGSFGFVVESPVREQDTAELIPGIGAVPSFERRVIERVVRGLSLISPARRANSKDTLLENFGAGLSANMCEAIAGLVDVTQGTGIEFSFELSSSVTSSLNSAAKQRVKLDAGDAEFLRNVALAMREKRAVRYSEFSGRVVALKTHSIPGDLTDLQDARQIVMAADIQSLGEIEIHINLRPEDYLEALVFHADGQPLRVVGNLEQIGRNWFLLDPRVQPELSLFETQRVTTSSSTRLALPPPKSRR